MVAYIPIQATDDDIIRVGDANPGWRIERDENGALVMTPTSGQSGVRNIRLSAMLFAWAERHDYIATDSSTGFRLPDKSVVSPDGALVARARWNALTAAERDAWLLLAPDVAIEVISKSDDVTYTRNKLLRMRRFGARYAVMIDPYRREIWTDGEPPDEFDLDFTPIFGE